MSISEQSKTTTTNDPMTRRKKKHYDSSRRKREAALSLSEGTHRIEFKVETDCFALLSLYFLGIRFGASLFVSACSSRTSFLVPPRPLIQVGLWPTPSAYWFSIKREAITNRVWYNFVCERISGSAACNISSSSAKDYQVPYVCVCVKIAQVSGSGSSSSDSQVFSVHLCSPLSRTLSYYTQS